MASIAPHVAGRTLDSVAPNGQPRVDHYASLLRMSSSQRLAQSPWVFRCSWLAVMVFAFHSMARLHVYIRAYLNVLMAMDYLDGSLVAYFSSVIAINSFNAVIHTPGGGVCALLERKVPHAAVLQATRRASASSTTA